jgi:hypothetical protein
VGDRNAYVNALEKESVSEHIVPFADFLAGPVEKRLAGEPLSLVPFVCAYVGQYDQECKQRQDGDKVPSDSDFLHDSSFFVM